MLAILRKSRVDFQTHVKWMKLVFPEAYKKLCRFSPEIENREGFGRWPAQRRNGRAIKQHTKIPADSPFSPDPRGYNGSGRTTLAQGVYLR
ncbi:hypothetical protein BaRGS_00040361 [Batillaria attramentaria]|uniref:Uncharacterized protein n=1 Tax=Batillaria attramentaria TaxID=370345 RepID=A0ABD0J0E4_9CAEN